MKYWNESRAVPQCPRCGRVVVVDATRQDPRWGEYLCVECYGDRVEDLQTEQGLQMADVEE